MGEATPGGGSLGEFRRALLRYRGLVGVAVDLETSLVVEEAEVDVMAEIAGEAERAVRSGESLEELATRLLDSGVLDRLVSRVASKLGIEEPESAAEALERLSSGDLESPHARAAFIAMQALARAYADKLLEVEGPREMLGTKCPVCGVESDIIRAEADGGYSMVCPFCFYTWRIPGRGLRCPRCGSSDPFALGVYTGRADKRVALLYCQDCGFTGRLILDRSIRAPRSVHPLIAMGADRFRAYVEDPGES